MLNSVELRECSYLKSNIQSWVGWLLKVKFSFKAKLGFQSTVVFLFLFFASLNTHVYTNYSIDQFPLYNFLTTVFFVQFSLYSFLCTVFSVQFSLYSFLCTVFSVQFSLHSFHCTVFFMQFSRCNFFVNLSQYILFTISLYSFLSKVFFYTDFYLHFFCTVFWTMMNRKQRRVDYIVL